jgi:UTP--glucose-1-phosphate uridylyltransferase
LSAVLIGDFFHNFCDGIFIGVAFKSCAVSFGWTVTSITVFHELIQELSDFLVLTKAAQLPAWQALLWNAASGLSVILGGIVIASAQVDDYTVGMLLAFGAGQYLYIGAVELMPMIHDTHHTAPTMDVSVGTDEEAADEQEPAATAAAPAAAMKVTPFDRAVGLVFFMVAVVVAGLILLNHEHCEVGSHSDSSGDGHNH